MTATTGGTYTLLVAVPDATTVEVGALSRIAFEPGWDADTGSAFGPGGLGRVDRHRDLAAARSVGRSRAHTVPHGRRGQTPDARTAGADT